MQAGMGAPVEVVSDEAAGAVAEFEAVTPRD